MREVAAARVGRPVVGEGDGGVAAVRLHVLAQRGDLVGHVVGDDGDRAMGDAGRHGSEAGGFGGGDHLLGRRGGGDVDVDHRPAEQRVAHGAADGAGREPSARQRGEHGLCLRARRASSASLRRGGAGAAMARRRYLSCAGLDAPVLHARRRIDCARRPPGVMVA